MEHKETVEINPSESDDLAAPPVPVDLDKFVVQVLQKCDCATLAKYFKGIQKEQFMRLTLRDIDRLLPTPITTSLKIYEEITNINKVLVQRQEFQLIDRTLKSVSSFKPISEGCNSSHSNCQTNDDGGLSFSFTPKKIKLVDNDNCDSYGIEKSVDEHPRERLCCQDQQTSDLVVGLSDESPTPENLTPSDQNDDIIVKAENLDYIMSSISRDDDDEVVIEVAETELRGSINPEFEIVVVVSDEETEATEHSLPVSRALMHPSASTTISASENPTLRDSLLQNRFSFVQTDTDKFIEVRFPSVHTDRLKQPKYGNLYAQEICTKISLLPEEGVIMKHRDCYQHQSPRQKKEWIEFYEKFGRSITSVKLNSWSWYYLTAQCPFNLFKILRHDCPNLEELIFNIGPHQVALDFGKADSSGWVEFQQHGNLPALRKIVIHVNAMHSKKVPVLLLQNILQASPNLEELSYEFGYCADARKILTTLSSFGSEFLEKMKILRILFADVSKTFGFVYEKDIKLLNKVQAKNLQEIFLSYAILQDMDSVEDCIEGIFLNFPILKKFVMCGTYYGKSSALNTKIIIQIPASLHLEHLEIYGFSEFKSVIEEPSSLITNDSCSDFEPQCINDDQSDNDLGPGPGQRPRVARTRRVTANERLEPVIVSVSISNLMPKLKTIILDACIEIEELHFRSIPQIATFRVESKWHLSVKFPSENSRRNCFQFLTELQIPNGLTDECFLLNLPQRFPNLTKCWISLPRVKCLRAFFKAMADSKLETIILCTRFYFESSLQFCFFGEMRMTDHQLENERKKWDELRKYGMFEEFKASKKMESPCWENIEEHRDNEKYAGLSALKHLKNLEMEHVPTVLRIPKGDADWRGPEAEFTQSCVGFKKYPLSKAFIKDLPSRMQFSKGSNFEIVEQKEDRDSSNDVDGQVQEETE